MSAPRYDRRTAWVLAVIFNALFGLALAREAARRHAERRVVRMRRAIRRVVVSVRRGV